MRQVGLMYLGMFGWAGTLVLGMHLGSVSTISYALSDWRFGLALLLSVLGVGIPLSLAVSHVSCSRHTPKDERHER